MKVRFLYYYFAGIYYIVAGAVQNRLSKRLGQKVSDSKLTSINPWMRAVPDQAATAKLPLPDDDAILSNRVRGF